MTVSFILTLMAGMIMPCYAGAHKKNIIRVAMLEYPNFMDWAEDGEPYGFACEYLQEIAKYTGWQYEYVPMSFSEAEQALKDGTIDILPGSQHTEERAKDYDYGTYPMTISTNVLCVRADNPNYYYNDYQSIDGIRISIMEGSIRSQQLQQAMSDKGVNAKFHAYKSDEEQKAALDRGEVDAILLASIRCTKEYKIIASANVSDLYFTCNPHDHAIREMLDSAQSEILSMDPYYNYKLYERYYGDIPFTYAFTEEERKFMENAEPITVAVSPDMKPYEYYDEKTDTFGGFVIAYFDRIHEITGLTFQFVVRGETDITAEELRSGKLWLIASVASNNGAKKQLPIQLSVPYYTGTTDMIAHDSVRTPYDPGCTIVIRTGFPQYQSLAERLGYREILYRDTFQECVNLVNEKKADLTLLPGYSAKRILNHAYLNHVSTQSIPISEFTCSIGISESCDSRLITILDKAISSMDQTEKNRIFLNAMMVNDDPITAKDLLYENPTLILTVITLAVFLIAVISLGIGIQRRKANLQLGAAKEEAERASAAKSEFLSRMSHDMRTPLNAILGMTYLGEGSNSLAETKDCLAKVQSSGEYLLGMINDTLDMTKIDTEKIVLKPEPYNQKELIETLYTLFESRAREKKIEFHVEAKGTKRTVLTDKLRLQQILFKLISNAIHFTGAGGTVEVLIDGRQVSDDWIEIILVVKDTGIGMSREFQKRMYEAFEQEHSSQDVGGTGLGLSIVKRLVDLEGGTITCKSEQGRGTEFSVSLMARIAPEPAQPEGMQKETVPQKTELYGKQVLLCEDHPLNVRIAERLLQKWGVEVTVAENGARGVELFTASEQWDFDAILMDIRMPVMDGLEAARNIRALDRPDAKMIPIIAVTANAFDEDIRKSVEAGINCHLAKPINPKQLYKTLEAYL